MTVDLLNAFSADLRFLRKWNIVFLVVLYPWATCLLAQTSIISGYVTDESTGETLIGANVYVKNDSWTLDFCNEIENFSGNGKDHDDQVDAVVNAFQQTIRRSSITL
jgi:hypothetical protein